MARKKKSTVSTLSTTAYKNVVLKDSDKNILLPRTDSSLVLYDQTTVSSTLDTLRSDKQDKLTAGTGIAIADDTISVTLDTTIAKVVTELPDTPDEEDLNKIFLVPTEEPINNPYLTKAEAEETYLAKSDAEEIYATKDDVTVLAVSGLASLSIWRGTRDEYDALTSYDLNTLYFIYET